MKIKTAKTVLFSFMLTVIFCGCGDDFWHPLVLKNNITPSELASYLSTLDDFNDKPYNISLKVSQNDEFNTIKEALKGEPFKYVNLDLSRSTIANIPDDAFNNCSSLINVTLPDNITEIGDHAFYYCSKLSSVNIPNSVKGIGNFAFSFCRDLASVSIPNGVTFVGSEAFYSCRSLDSIIIPDSVKGINWGAFFSCSNLTSVTIGSGVTFIGEDAFRSCIRLSSITIPSSVTRIQEGAFWGCNSLAKVIFQGTIPSDNFASDAFMGDLRTKFYIGDSTNGHPGTWSNTNPGENATWYWYPL